MPPCFITAPLPFPVSLSMLPPLIALDLMGSIQYQLAASPLDPRKAPATPQCPSMSFEAQARKEVPLLSSLLSSPCPPASRIPPHSQIAALSAVMTAFAGSSSAVPWRPHPTDRPHPVQYLIYKLSVTSPSVFSARCSAYPHDYGLAPYPDKQAQTVYISKGRSYGISSS